MRSRLILAALAALLLAGATGAWAQTATVKGKVSDEQGQPIADAVIEYASQDTGRKYHFKTNKKGEYFSIGVQSGTYKVNLYLTEEDQKAGRVKFFFNQVQVLLSRADGINPLDIDLAKEHAQAAPQMTEQQRKEQEEALKENVQIKNLNELLAQSRAARDAGNFDQAIALMQQAVGFDATRDLLWFNLGEAYLGAKRWAEAAGSYQKAIAIKPSGAYYNNLGQALSKTGKVDEAVAAYESAAQNDPAGAGQYYFNMGAVLTNSGRVDPAIVAFERCIAADPNRADAYYQKGILLAGKSQLKDGKYIPPPGTVEALNKVIELQPDGQLAAQAQAMLTELGGEIQSIYKRSKTKKQ